jgi:hypothetical protein
MELAKILLTAAFTIGGGIVLFCFTTVANKLFFEPVLALRKTLGDISFSLQYHAWAIHAGKGSVKAERLETIFEELRTLVARMRAEANSIIVYRWAERWGLIPPHQNIIDAAGHVIRLSNTLGSERWDTLDEDWKAVSQLLRIDVGRPKYKKDVRS